MSRILDNFGPYYGGIFVIRLPFLKMNNELSAVRPPSAMHLPSSRRPLLPRTPAIRVGKGRGDVVPAMGRGRVAGSERWSFRRRFGGEHERDGRPRAASGRLTARRALRRVRGAGRLLGAPSQPQARGRRQGGETGGRGKATYSRFCFGSPKTPPSRGALLATTGRRRRRPFPLPSERRRPARRSGSR